MNKKTINKIYNKNRFSLSARAIGSDSLVYYQMVCPHCTFENVIAKGFMHEMMLCSNTKCRRVIVVENYRDIITFETEDENKSA